ncbi:MAG: hypothetical protein V1928_02430 [Parcubacteria group bacterium]
MEELKQFLATPLEGNPPDGTKISISGLIDFFIRRWQDSKMLWLCNWLPLEDKRNVVWMFMILPPQVEAKVANIFRAYKSVMDAKKILAAPEQITAHYGEMAKICAKLADVFNDLAAGQKR